MATIDSEHFLGKLQEITITIREGSEVVQPHTLTLTILKPTFSDGGTTREVVVLEIGDLDNPSNGAFQHRFTEDTAGTWDGRVETDGGGVEEFSWKVPPSKVLTPNDRIG